VSKLKFNIVTALVMISAIVGIVLLARHAQDKAQLACERRGGVYFQAHGGYLCLSPEALK
jgi:hypothetical protein